MFVESFTIVLKNVVFFSLDKNKFFVYKIVQRYVVVFYVIVYAVVFGVYIYIYANEENIFWCFSVSLANNDNVKVSNFSVPIPHQIYIELKITYPNTCVCV